MSKLLLLILAAAFSFPALAHEHEETSEAVIELYRKMTEWTPVDMQEHSASTPYVRINGQYVYMNGAFWELSRGWIRVYYKEIQNECDGCIQVSEEEFTRLAEDHVGRSFWAYKGKEIGHMLMEGAEHAILGAVDIGARYGKFALGLKLTGEAIETVLSVMAPTAGMHLFCNAIDAFILFGTRYAQIHTRAFMWGHVYDRTRLGNFVRSAFVSRVVKKAQKKVRFVTGPVDVDEEALKEVDLEGPNRWWGWVPDGKRAAWVRKLVARADRDGKSEMKLKMKKFLGKRLWRYALLKARKRGNSQFMHGSSPIDKTLNQHVIWMLEVQESILQRALVPKGEEVPTINEGLAATATAGEDSIRSGLAAEFFPADVSKESRQLVEGILRDVEVVFNPDLPYRVRYFQAAALENLLGGFVYGMFMRVLNEKGDIYGASPGGIWNQARFHWNVGKFGGHIYEWSDFLRLAALQNDRDVLQKYKFEAMESLLRIMGYIRKTEPLTRAETKDDLRKIEDDLLKEYGLLKTFRPWVEKRVGHSWLPFRGAPTCRKMNEAVGL